MITRKESMRSSRDHWMKHKDGDNNSFEEAI